MKKLEVALPVKSAGNLVTTYGLGEYFCIIENVSEVGHVTTFCGRLLHRESSCYWRRDVDRKLVCIICSRKERGAANEAKN